MAKRSKKRKGAIRQWLSNTWSAISTRPGDYKALSPGNKLLNGNANYPYNNKATANEILASGQAGLRSYGRDLERNNSTARAVIESLVANVVGSGIGLEPDVEDENVAEIISKEFNAYIQSCSVDGASVYELQRRAMRDVPAAGEAVWRFVPSDNPSSDIPIAVIGLESEWLADDVPYQPTENITYANGIALDRYGRPVFYYMKPPNQDGEYEQVPADQISLIFERRRSLQARGESWFAPTIEALFNEKDLVDTELYAAKQTASLAIAVTSEYHDDSDLDTDDSDDPAQDLRIGSVSRLFPGDDVKALKNDRPSQQISPFRDMLRGDIAAAMRTPKRFLDRDVSKANYSSMRADMLDNQRLIGPVQDWFGHQTIGALYRKVLPYILIKHGLPANTPATYLLLPDGQPYVDPAKDIAAAVMSMEAGLSSQLEEQGKRGKDYRKTWKQLKTEEGQQEELGLSFGENGQQQEPEEPEEDEQESTDEEDASRSINVEYNELGQLVRMTNEKC